MSVNQKENYLFQLCGIVLNPISLINLKMNHKAIPYKNTWLFPGSEAYMLYCEKQFDKLDKHLKEVERKYHELMKGN